MAGLRREKRKAVKVHSYKQAGRRAVMSEMNKVRGLENDFVERKSSILKYLLYYILYVAERLILQALMKCSRCLESL